MITNNVIRIGFLNDPVHCKGIEFKNHLANCVHEHRGYRIEYPTITQDIPRYEQNDFFQFIKRHSISGLFYTNNLAESYCFSLSYGINSGLPLFYNSLGALKERLEIVDDNRWQPRHPRFFKLFDNESELCFNETVEIKFKQMLDYIIENQGTQYNLSESCEVICNEFYKKLLD